MFVVTFALLPRTFFYIHDFLDDMLLIVVCFGLGFVMMGAHSGKNALVALALLLFHHDAVTQILNKLHDTQWASSPTSWAILSFCWDNIWHPHCFFQVVVIVMICWFLNFQQLSWEFFVQKIWPVLLRVLPRLDDWISSFRDWSTFVMVLALFTFCL